MTSTGNLLQARAARPEDAEPTLQVLCAAFGIDPDIARALYYQDPFFDLSHKRVLATPKDGIVSSLTVIPAMLRIGDALVPTAGIAGVATHPAHQRCGYASRLLSATVGALAEELSYPVAALFPYSYDFYRAFGWATASRAAVWSGPTDCLPSNQEAAHVRPIRTEAGQDRLAVHRLHEAATRTRTGACHRDPRRWKVIDDLIPSRQTVVYENRLGVIDGYLFFEVQTSGDQATLIVHEMHGRTEGARRGLVGFLSRRQGNASHLNWEACPEDLHLFGLFSLPFLERHQPQITLKPGMMLRLIDVPSALMRIHAAHLSPILKAHAGMLTIRPTDALRPANARPICLHSSGVHSGSHSDRDWLAADITVLSQLYTGYLTPSEAALLGLLTVSSAETLALADRLFPTRQPFVSPVDQF